MIRRWLAAGVFAVATLGVASATTLGTFDDIVLSGVARSVDACVATTTTFYSGVLGSLEPISLGLLSTSDVDFVGLEISGDCTGDLRPVVVTVGDGLLTEPTVLSRSLLGQVEEDLTADSEVLLPVSASDELNLLDVTFTVQSVRVGFCPAGVTSCEP